MRIALVVVAVWLAGCGHSSSPAAVRIALNWFPEPEHGGYFAADVDGLSVDILSGGPGVPVVPRVASREVDFGVINADDVVAARAAGVPVVAVLAPIHRSPWCVMVHARSGIERLADLHDVTLAMQAGTPELAWLERTVRLERVRVVPYAGSVAPFLANDRYAQQAYVFSEPIIARTKGADPRCLSIAETGFDPYASVLVTSEALLREHPERVRAVAAASAAGWRRYVDEPDATNARILARNPEIGRAVLAEGAAALRPLVLDDAARRSGVGSMDPARWATLVRQMLEIGAIEGPLDPATVYELGFVPAS